MEKYTRCISAEKNLILDAGVDVRPLIRDPEVFCYVNSTLKELVLAAPIELTATSVTVHEVVKNGTFEPESR